MNAWFRGATGPASKPACLPAYAAGVFRKKWPSAKICQKVESAFAAAINIPRAHAWKSPCPTHRVPALSSCRFASFFRSPSPRRDFSDMARLTFAPPNSIRGVLLFFARARYNRLPVYDRIPQHALVSAIQIAMQRIEIECNDMPLSHRRIQNRRPSDQVPFSPNLTTHQYRRAVSVAPLQYDAASIHRPVQARGAIGHAQPPAWRRIQGEVLTKHVCVRRISVRDRVVRSIERRPHMGAGSPRECLLRRRSRLRPSTLGTPWHAPRISPHAAHDPRFQRKHRTTSERDEQSTLLDKVLQLRQPFPPDSTGNVLGRRWRAQTRSLRCFVERHRTPLFRQTLNLLRELEIHVSIHQHINLVL